MAKGYWVSVYHEIRDDERLADYAKLAGPAIRDAGGAFLARGVASKAYEAGIVQRVVVVEFPSVEAAETCHDSSAYQAALDVLGDAVTRDLRIVEGIE